MAAVVSRGLPVLIVPLEPDRRLEASRVLARAFVTNPLHVAAFGPAALAVNEAFFRVGLAAMQGPKLAALDESRIVGVIHWVGSAQCQFSAFEKLRMLPALVRGLGLGPALSLSSWLSTWSRHDPDEPHVHLGPIGVAPEAQGRQIGRRLMDRYCEDLGKTGEAGYLETDRPENVEFYRRFGFETIATAPVLGVTNYFMRRKPGT